YMTVDYFFIRRLVAMAASVGLAFLTFPSAAEVSVDDGEAPPVNPQSTEPPLLPTSQSLNWYTRDQLTEQELTTLPSFCQGLYRPVLIDEFNNDRIEADADEATLQLGTNTLDLEGNVVFQQKKRRLLSDQANWNPDARSATFDGNVKLLSNGLVVQGSSAFFNEAEGQTQLSGTEYSIPERHLRGSAKDIRIENQARIMMSQATLTFCPPGHNDWDIAANQLKLNRESGYGSALHSRLRVKGVPVFYMPYYRFPIDDRRLTGFLDPTITINELGQAEDIQLPFYLNIAPNMDATITPHHVLDHGLLMENQFRHKTRLMGDGELNYGYLGDDEETGKERSLINYSQNGRWGEFWTHSWLYNNVSDDDYFSDMNSSAAVDRQTHLPRFVDIRYKRSQFDTTFLAKSYQTIDDLIALRDRPYRQLPQITTNINTAADSDWTVKQRLQVTRFNRESSATIDGQTLTLSGIDALNGDRVVSDTSFAYPMSQPFGSLTPAADFRYRAYRLYDGEDTNNAESRQFSSGRYSLDGQLIFERDMSWFGTDYLQTFEPRAMYVYSPLVKGQDDIPTFDTAVDTLNFSSLFRGDRFSGDDRLADLNQVATAVTTRFINDTGRERLRASLGAIWYFADREVTLDAVQEAAAERSTSTTLAEAEWNPGQYWTVFSFVEYDPYQNYARQQRYGMRYSDDSNHMISFSRTSVENRELINNFTSAQQSDISAFWAINDRWAVFGRQLRDLSSYDEGEAQPEEPVLESLAGVEYQSCCWRTQFVYRETSPLRSGEITTEKKYGWMLSFQLKGLTTIGSGTDELLSDSIYGYTRRQYHDF
ncbi:MAG: LPS assembly protein LptD, partial [Oleibacter sp.]|nr:LPS assembly protein LptD [Thalassolituus sp.]